jgi:hypothetical protein
MGYAKGVRNGHAGSHLREPACALVEAISADDPCWWEVDSGNGRPFASPAAAYNHLGRLWHCKDVVPESTRLAAERILDRDLGTYAALVRALRPVLAERIKQGVEDSTPATV